MNQSPAIQTTRKIARPLKVLIPLIQGELQQGNDAGHEHYRRAGEMLIEAKDQIGYGGWGKWLSKNFDLSDRTAQSYMRWAREHRSAASEVPYQSMREMMGQTERARERAQSPQHQAFKRVLRDINRDRDTFVQERQTRDEENKITREMAMKFIDFAYRGLAKEYHPDQRGGSKEAMARLNRIRDAFKQFAQTRRFV